MVVPAQFQADPGAPRSFPGTWGLWYLVLLLARVLSLRYSVHRVVVRCDEDLVCGSLS